MMYLAIINESEIISDSFEWITKNIKPYLEIDPIDLDGNIIDQVFSIYKLTYSKLNKSLYIKDKFALLKYERWIIVVDEKQTVRSFALYRSHNCGIKLGITAALNSKKDKQGIVNLNRKALNVESVFAEVSPPLEKVLEGNVPKVKASNTILIFGKEKNITIDKDRLHYHREIKGLGIQRKLLVGRPLTVKT